jgi:hypothetical protein
MVEGSTIGHWFFEVDNQPEVGPAAYDQGAAMLTDFFHEELAGFLEADLLPAGRAILECCLDGGGLEDYVRLLDLPFLEPDDG